MEGFDQAAFGDKARESAARAAAAAHKIKLIDIAAWAGKPIPPRAWIVQDWLPSGAITALYGDGGTN